MHFCYEIEMWVPFNIVAFLLKARIVKRADAAVARKRSAITPVPRQWLSTRHVIAAARSQ
jgi:hypothetical protein